MGLLCSAHQPVYMPWLGLLHKIAAADVFISWDDVQQEDSGFENRNQVLTSKGPQWLTIPCRRGRELMIRHVEVASDQSWRRKHFRTLELAYSKAQHWARHAEFLQWYYGQGWKRLVEWNDAMLDYMINFFQVRGPRFFTLSGLNGPTHSDLDGAAKANATIISACHAVGANQYLFGEHGIDYASKEAFRAGGVEPFVQDYDCKPYPQVNAHEGDFTSRLSALDLMMNVEQGEAIRVMMAGGSTRRMG